MGSNVSYDRDFLGAPPAPATRPWAISSPLGFSVSKMETLCSSIYFQFLETDWASFAGAPVGAGAVTGGSTVPAHPLPSREARADLRAGGAGRPVWG